MIKRCTRDVMGIADQRVYGKIVNELHEMVRAQYRGIATSVQRLNDYGGHPDLMFRLTWEQRRQTNYPRILSLLKAYLAKRETHVASEDQGRTGTAGTRDAPDASEGDDLAAPLLTVAAGYRGSGFVP